MRLLRVALVVVLGMLSLLAAAVPAAAGGGCHVAEFSDQPSDVVKAYGNCFYPTVARVDVGDTVRWHSGDEMSHTVTAVAEGFRSLDELTIDSRLRLTFDEPGVFPYTCLLHPGMGGAIVVGDGVVAEAEDEDEDGSSGSLAAPPGGDDSASQPRAEEPATTVVVANQGENRGPLIAIVIALAAAAALGGLWQRAARRGRVAPAPARQP